MLAGDEAGNYDGRYFITVDALTVYSVQFGMGNTTCTTRRRVPSGPNIAVRRIPDRFRRVSNSDNLALTAHVSLLPPVASYNFVAINFVLA